jgi:redox-regulated HSP33 family molecular chaperone
MTKKGMPFMKNYLVRVISEKLNVLGLACVTTNLVNEACHLHGTSPAACAALGRALTGGAMMAALLRRLSWKRTAAEQCGGLWQYQMPTCR